MTLGDVLFVVSAIFLVGATVWGATILCATLFKTRLEPAATWLEAGPWKTFGLGLLLGLPVITFGLILVAFPHPVTKFLGTVVWAFTLLSAVYGGASIALVIAKRLRTQTPELTQSQAVNRGAILLVAAQALPIVGMFLVWPFVFFASIGCAARAMRSKALSAPTPPPEII